MRIGLGIDTGGTYTDGVVYDFDKQQVISRAKAETTPQDLSIGIERLLDTLPPALLSDITMVSLSTTLATNACVEDVGGRAALVLMGYDNRLMDFVGGDYGLSDAVIVRVPGAHSQRGEEDTAPDYPLLEQEIAKLKGSIDAVGIVEYWGVRNPEYEKEAKRRIRKLTGLPVAAAHELTDEINSMRRAASTLLNARLIPLIDRLILAVERMLMRRDIDVPLVVVRGDGSVMSKRYAREYPVETLLSGPAASVLGAMRLCNEADLIAVDTGGTTTDLAIVRGGRTQIAPRGVNVGRYRTGTRAIAVSTFALGGDTQITLDSKNQLCLGSRRALPLCVLAKREPAVRRELTRMLEEDREVGYSRGTFYTLRALPEYTDGLTKDELAILEVLKPHALSVEQLADALSTRPYFLNLERLVSRGILLPASLTPTDIMHLRGEYAAWDTRASVLGSQLLAKQLSITPLALIEAAMSLAGERMYLKIADMLLARALPKLPDEPVLKSLAYRPKGDEISVSITTPLPLVLIGAPTHVMAVQTAQALSARTVHPEDAAVAGAVGAITGNVLAEEVAHIQPLHEVYGIDGFAVHTSEGYQKFDDLASAQRYATREARRIAEDRARQMGASEVTVSVKRAASQSQTGGAILVKLLLSLDVTATAVGKLSGSAGDKNG